MRPSLINARISSTSHCASMPSEGCSMTRTGSPSPCSVQRFLPRRPVLCPMRALAESRMWPYER
ncbi:Uncharacterised protein [Bordetella pertussis]|nr:Uncharacterised protein [Bordetella pertussis]CPK93968.1 Uncharacterised protein [Bordetella pertussis]